MTVHVITVICVMDCRAHSSLKRIMDLTLLNFTSTATLKH